MQDFFHLAAGEGFELSQKYLCTFVFNALKHRE
nr:MAG TPA: hypothetical protein [Caudoviricetes sp.]